MRSSTNNAVSKVAQKPMNTVLKMSPTTVMSIVGDWRAMGNAAESISAIYELIEFAAAMALGAGADAFLGSQGDVWDTQWDMLMCLTGAVLALAALSRWHDRMIAADPFIGGSASPD